MITPSQDDKQPVTGPPKIPGGYFIIARKMFDGELMDKPPLFMKLWAWMLNSAFWKDGEKLNRGQLLTSVPEMQAAMSYKIGYRTKTPTTDEVRSAYEAFMKAGMITATKAGCGVRISICKYSYYQDFKNYEARDEARDENPVKPEGIPNQREGRLKEGEGNESKTSLPSELFNLWNTTVEGKLSAVQKLTESRSKKIKTRLKERPLSDWKTVFEKMASSSFCQGDNKQGWKADFDWIIDNDNNAVKVLEGKYDPRPMVPQQQPEQRARQVAL